MSSLPDNVMRHLVRVSAEPDLSGTPFEIEGEIGRGGMGVVYAARDRRLGRRVAVKVLYTGDLVLEEARIIASLEHPGIVPVYEAGPNYYAMKLVEGRSLEEHLQGGAALSERLRVIQKICETVAFAHSRGVAHRDLKPGNIMVGSFGEVVILDWGIARHADTAERPGVVAGTPRFMAPEMRDGRGNEADHRVDIYSLGALFEACLPADAPRALRAIAAKARSERVEDRYSSADEVNREISRYLDGAAVKAHRETTVERLLRFTARNKTLLLLLAAYLAVRIFLYFLRSA